jgi:rhodanese-related sulfurtransferase
MHPSPAPQVELRATAVWKAAFLQAGVLILCAMVPTMVSARLNLQWSSPAEFNALPAKSAHADAEHILFVDVRNPDRFEAGHAPGALAVRPETYDAIQDSIRARWQNQKRIVVYGEGTGSERALQIARRLRKDMGAAQVLLLEGGWAAWPRN